MKNEILVVSDNFNEYSKYRSFLEGPFSISLRNNIDEVRQFLNEKDVSLVIIDLDETLENGLFDIVKLLDDYDVQYLIVVDNPHKFILSVDDDYIEKDIISRQSIYPNFYKIINSIIDTGGNYEQEDQ